MTAPRSNPISGQAFLPNPPPVDASSVAHASQRLTAAQRALFDHDADVLAKRTAPDFDTRFLLDLERRCAQLRYDTEINPI